LDLFDSAAKIKNISIKYNPSNECTIYADQNMLQTILRNLTSNAIKYTNNGGCITIAHVLTASQVTISISDNGIGMTQEIINNLWEFTSKLSIRGTDGEKGTGLGLILCKEFIDKHKGEIWVKSEPGNGSTFSFTLPLIN
jgi:signal transduction histidine kinase